MVGTREFAQMQANYISSVTEFSYMDAFNLLCRGWVWVGGSRWINSSSLDMIIEGETFEARRVILDSIALSCVSRASDRMKPLLWADRDRDFGIQADAVLSTLKGMIGGD